MQMHPCDSSMITAYGYEPRTLEMDVQFKTDGAVWRYKGVRQALFESFLAAESKGRFFTSRIKGKHESERL